MLARTVLVLGCSLLATTLVHIPQAEACGGCFTVPDATGSVDSHNMVVSLSATRTVLWDQIVYSGDPKDFVWVLPLPTTEAKIEVADQEFFNQLEEITAPRIRAPPRPLRASEAEGCGDSSGNSGGVVTLTPDGGSGVNDTVVVHDRSVVGPYETVIIGSENADDLQNWLVANNYRVAESVVPTIAYYVERGDVFAVLRLAPGQGVQAMQPIRVQYPGYMARFPLRMVKVGAQIFLELNLLVFAAERFEAANFDNVSIQDIDRDQLVFDYDGFTSNYNELFDDLIRNAGGSAWVTEYAGVLDAKPRPLEEDRPPEDLIAPDHDLFPSPESPTDFDLVFEDNAFPMLTRMRTKMELSNIADDLVLDRSEDNRSVSGLLQAANSRNDPRGDVRVGGDGGCRIEKYAHGRTTAAAMLLFALLMGFRRKQR